MAECQGSFKMQHDLDKVKRHPLIATLAEIDMFLRRFNFLARAFPPNPLRQILDPRFFISSRYHCIHLNTLHE